MPNVRGGTRLSTAGKAGAAVTITVAGLLAILTIGRFEGLRLAAYKDVIGVWTACYGETKGIKPGMKFTKEQCDYMFIGGLERHEKIMRSCLNSPDSLPDKTYVAFLSLTYNIGGAGFCKSSIARDVNNGRLVQACDDLLRFNKAGGRVVQGLVTRRNQERRLCLEGLRDKQITLPPATPTPVDAPAPIPPAAAPPPPPAPAAEEDLIDTSDWWKWW